MALLFSAVRVTQPIMSKPLMRKKQIIQTFLKKQKKLCKTTHL